MKLLLCFILFSVMLFPQITNINVIKEENTLHLTWDVDDSTYYDAFHVFYVQSEVAHSKNLNNALNWYMSYSQCWEWIRETTYFQHEAIIIPNTSFEPNTSLIRLGIIGEKCRFSETGELLDRTFSSLHLAPDILY